MFFSLQQLISDYSGALSKRARPLAVYGQGGFYVCLNTFFKKENIIVESFSRGILIIKVPHASAMVSIESKKEKIILCFKRNNIPVKKIICKI